MRALTDFQIVEKSQELDVLIFKYQKLLLLKRLVSI
ncbi:Spo0E family sporulation regulatory protein-aspartic acid phosphatase [Bacillus sp. V2I10]